MNFWGKKWIFEAKNGFLKQKMNFKGKNGFLVWKQFFRGKNGTAILNMEFRKPKSEAKTNFWWTKTDFCRKNRFWSKIENFRVKHRKTFDFAAKHRFVGFKWNFCFEKNWIFSLNEFEFEWISVLKHCYIRVCVRKLKFPAQKLDFRCKTDF